VADAGHLQVEDGGGRIELQPRGAVGVGQDAPQGSQRRQNGLLPFFAALVGGGGDGGHDSTPACGYMRSHYY
jgi:hypothetical protein